MNEDYIDSVDITHFCWEHTRPDLDYLLSRINKLREKEPEVHPDEAGSFDHEVRYAKWQVLEDTIHDVILLVKEEFE